MIVRPRPSTLALLFTMRGSILPVIAPRLVAVLALSAIVASLQRTGLLHLPEVTAAPFTLLGLALSIFLGFRNNACYERWWEGRRQMGQLVAEVRTLARDLAALLSDDVLRRRCVRRAVAFAHALRNQLRGDDHRAPPAWLDPDEGAAVGRRRSQPDAILCALVADLGASLRARTLTDIGYSIVAERLSAMTTIQTACERLRSTPPPFAYSLLLHRTAWLFCLLLPFGFVGTLGLAVPLLTVPLAYAFFGLDALGDQLEEPFSTADNALPLDAIVRTIEIAAAEALGDADVPEPLLPRDGVLL